MSPKKEIIRASKYIHNDGIGSIRLKMDLNDFIKLFNMYPNINKLNFEQKTVFVSNPVPIKIGDYPIDNIKGYFFKNKLYWIVVNFSENREELFEAFISHFPNASQKHSMSKGKQTFTATKFIDEKNVAFMLAPMAKYRQWESITFYSIKLTKEKEKYKREAIKLGGR